MNWLTRFCTSTLLGSGLCIGAANANESQTEQTDDSNWQVAEDVRNSLSSGVIGISSAIDRIFGSERAAEDANQSRIHLSLGATLLREGKVTQNFYSRYRLHLPRTNDRLSIVIETDPSSEQEEHKELSQNPTNKPAEESANAITSAIQFVIKRSKDLQIRAHAGARFDGDVDPTVRLKIRRKWLLGSWTLRASEHLFWFQSEGLGETTQIDFEKNLNSHFFFRATSKATWREQVDLFELSQSATFYQHVGKDHYLAYQISVHGETEPDTRFTAYRANIHFRKMIYKNWLFLDLSPQLLRHEEDNFTTQPSFTASLEIIFGAPANGTAP